MIPYRSRSHRVRVRRRPGTELTVLSSLKQSSLSLPNWGSPTRRHSSMLLERILSSRSPAPCILSSLFNRFNSDSVRNLLPLRNCYRPLLAAAHLHRVPLPHSVLNFL